MNMIVNEIPEVTAATFASEVLDADLPVAVDFYSPWCGPCQIMERVMGKLADEFAGRVKFVRVNAENETDLAERFDVTSVPTFILLGKGRILRSVAGQASFGWLAAILSKEAGPKASELAEAAA